MKNKKLLTWLLSCLCIGALSFGAACGGSGDDSSVSSSKESVHSGTSSSTPDSDSSSDEASSSTPDSDSSSDEASSSTPDVDSSSDEVSSSTPDSDSSSDEASSSTPDSDSSSDEASSSTPDSDSSSDEVSSSTPDNDSSSDEVSSSTPDNDSSSDEVSSSTPDVDSSSDEVSSSTPDNDSSSSEEVSSPEDSSPVDDALDENASEGLEYTLSSDGTYYSVTKGTCEDAEVVIASKYKGLPVTTIAKKAFYNYSNLTKIIIPDSVTKIERMAFSGCSNLSYNEYGNCKYLGNENNLYLYLAGTSNLEIDTVEIHKDCKWIGEYAFQFCNNLTEIILPDGVLGIGELAFSYCESLTKVIIPDSVTWVESLVFSGCTNLSYKTYGNCQYLGNENNPYLYLIQASNKNIYAAEIHENCKFIEGYAFYDCRSIMKMVIPEGVKSIGTNAFQGCTNLNAVVLPESLTRIGNVAFHCCNSLTSITFNGTMEQWNAIEKGSNWNLEIRATQVVCCNGTVTL